MKHTTNFFTFLIIILCLFVMPVSAFEDDFDDGEIASDWTLSGTWNLNAGGMPSATSNYSVSTTTTPSQSYSLTQSTAIFTPNYVSFWVKHTSNTDGGFGYVDFSDSQDVQISSDNQIKINQDSGQSSVGSIGNNVWNRIEVTRSGTNFIINIYDASDSLSSSQTIAADVDDMSFIRLRASQSASGGSITTHFDDIKVLSVSPYTTNSIDWDLDQYTEGDTASYSWTLQNSFWQDLIYKYRVQILKDGSEIDTMKVSQSGTRYQDVDNAGTYEVKLQYSGLFPTNWQTIDSDSVNVIPEVDSYINVPKTAPQRTNFTVNYLYGSTPSNGLILMKRLDETTGIYETVEFDLLGSDKHGGTAYNRNMSLHSTGTYKITLIHDEQVDEIYDVIEITSLYVPPIETVGNSSISSDKSTYAIGETIFAQYAVDYTNYTTYNVNMEVYNIDKDIISYSVPTIDQISYISQTIPITNEYFTGSHTLRLTSYDDTGTKVAVLASKNITVGLVNDGGFGLSLSKYDVMQLELFVIKAISPTSANIRVWSVERDVQVGGLITINGSTYLNYAIPRTGNYEITLSSGGFEIAKQYITVHEGFVDGEIEDEIEDDDVAFDTSFELMLSSGSFIALLIIIACVGAFGKIGGVVGVFLGMVVGISISFLMDYLPAWILFIMVLALCVVFVSKLINSFGGSE